MSTSPFPPFGNMYAPPWCGFSPVLAGLRDMEYDLDLPPVAVPGSNAVSGGFARNNQLALDGDADFLVREIQFVVLPPTAGVIPSPSSLRVRIRDGDGRLFTSDFMPILDLNGPLVPAWPLRRGSVLTIDYQNLQAAGNTANVWMLLKGWKRLQCSDPTEAFQDYTPMYARYMQAPAGSEFEEFEYPVVATAAVAGDQLKIPIQTDNDADFLWRGLTGDWNTDNNDVAAVGNVALTFYDVDGVPLSKRPLTVPWGSLVAGQFRESMLPNGGGRPAPQWPEILIPRGGVIQYDISFGAAATCRFSLRGVKIYGGC